MLRGHREYMPSNPIMWPSVCRKTVTVIPPFSNQQPTRRGRFDAFGRRSPPTRLQDDGGSLVRQPRSSNALLSVHYFISREKSICNVLCFQAEERRGPAECADEGGELDERRQGSRQGLSTNDAGARPCKLRTPQKPTYEWEAATLKRSRHLRLMTSLFPKKNKTNKQTSNHHAYTDPHKEAFQIFPLWNHFSKMFSFGLWKRCNPDSSPLRWMDTECYSLQWKQGLSLRHFVAPTKWRNICHRADAAPHLFSRPGKS